MTPAPAAARPCSTKLFFFDDPGPIDASRLGGKAATLARLGRQGLAVPAWFCVTTAFFDTPEESLLEAAHDALFAGEAVAVRSSVVGEDSAVASFAGLMESYLNVHRAGLAEHIRRCRLSAFSGRALAYRRRLGLPIDGIGAAVIVQRMVDARAAGVLFTRDVDGGSGSVVSAALGLGEGVVADRAESDTYWISRPDRAIRRRIATKTVRIATDPAGSTRSEPVPADQGGAPVLEDGPLLALVD
ncbi:MAG: hypothetical protein HY815_08605, partial [Candidatus Riflebacteria bacterium]|nr:hypothetical protein [Candidatus Riflebacteria bacterium]